MLGITSKVISRKCATLAFTPEDGAVKYAMLGRNPCWVVHEGTWEQLSRGGRRELHDGDTVFLTPSKTEYEFRVEVKRLTSGKRSGSPIDGEPTKKKARKESPGVAEESPGVAEESPGVAEESPGVAEESPGAAEESPGAAKGLDPAEVMVAVPSPVSGGWTCPMCTFQNHELLQECEMCTRPRVSGSAVQTALPETPPQPSAIPTGALRRSLSSTPASILASMCLAGDVLGEDAKKEESEMGTLRRSLSRQDSVLRGVLLEQEKNEEETREMGWQTLESGTVCLSPLSWFLSYFQAPNDAKAATLVKWNEERWKTAHVITLALDGGQSLDVNASTLNAYKDLYKERATNITQCIPEARLTFRVTSSDLRWSFEVDRDALLKRNGHLPQGVYAALLQRISTVERAVPYAYYRRPRMRRLPSVPIPFSWVEKSIPSLSLAPCKPYKESEELRRLALAEANAQGDAHVGSIMASAEDPKEKSARGTGPVTQDGPLPHAQPPTLVGKQLYEHQLRALAWMVHVEDHMSQGHRVSVALPQRPEYDGLVSETVHTRGGIYADEMGLGKTLAVVALILARPRKGSRRAAEAPINRDSAALEVNGTLIACPSHLAKQWKDEIAAVAELTVIVICTMAHLAKVSYEAIIDADVVIVSHTFLINSRYLAAVGDLANAHKGVCHRFNHPSENLQTRAPILQHFGWHRIVVDEGHEILADTGKMPNSKYQEVFFSFMSNYRWYVTGTPLPHKQISLVGALSFLEFFTEGGGGDPCENNPVRRGSVYMAVKERLFWRNTKESVGADKVIPGIVEKVLKIRLSEVERAMYQAASAARNNMHMRQLCCHPQISAQDRAVLGNQGRSLEDIRTMMIKHSKEEVVRARRALVEATEAVEKFERSMDKQRKKWADKDAKLPQGATLSKEEVEDREKTTKANDKQRKRLIKQVSGLEDSLRTKATQTTFFASLVPRATEMLKEPCLVCFEDITDAGVAKCGHLYCVTCIRSAIRAQGCCPMCRAPLTQQDVTAVRDASNPTTAAPDELVQQHGAKMATLIRYLRQCMIDDPDAKAIVFSQWDNLLERIGATLNEEEISTVYCKGNVHMRNKAIESFKQKDGPRVLMLSLDNAASGTNLTEARHVVLVDPVAGTREEAAAVEAQAIGRAHRVGQKSQVTVVRLITANTIESEMFDARQ